MRRVLLPVLSGLALIAGCGDSGGDTAGEPSRPVTEAMTGKQIFLDSSCASCHRLADVDAEGVTGPDLDKRRPDAGEIADQVRSGGGGMPAYDGRLSDAQIDTLAKYIASVAGN